MYKSNTENYFAERCKAMGIEFVYEPKTHTLLEKVPVVFFTENKAHRTSGIFSTHKTTREIKYTPDFVLPDHKWIVEIKGTIYQERSFPLVMKLFLKHMAEDSELSDFRFIVIRTKRGCDEFLKRLKYGISEQQWGKAKPARIKRKDEQLKEKKAFIGKNKQKK